MLNYTNYIRRITICFNERLAELELATTSEDASQRYLSGYGWLDGIAITSSCVIDSDLRAEMTELLTEMRGVLADAHRERVFALEHAAREKADT